MANEQQLVLADMMTGRHTRSLGSCRVLRRDPEVFGDPVPGTGDEPGVLLSGVHYLRKVVAGLPNPHPAWYFDVTEQGEGLTDTGAHLVDRVQPGKVWTVLDAMLPRAGPESARTPI
jgi:hypothetical protein